MLAYLIAFPAYLWLRRRFGDPVSTPLRWVVFATAVAGAALGSKLLYWFEDPQLTWQNLHNPAYLMGGKTIVGALAFGLASVELIKRFIGLRQPTGDLYAIPLALGIAIGRVGCFLTGLPDNTYGTPTILLGASTSVTAFAAILLSFTKSRFCSFLFQSSTGSCWQVSDRQPSSNGQRILSAAAMPSNSSWSPTCRSACSATSSSLTRPSSSEYEEFSGLVSWFCFTIPRISLAGCDRRRVPHPVPRLRSLDRSEAPPARLRSR